MQCLKNLLVWNYKAQSFHMWYIALSRDPLPRVFKLCPWGQIWPCPGGHNFTLNYIRKISNDFSLTTYGNLSITTVMVPGWSPTKIVQIVLIVCISRSRGQKRVFNSKFSIILSETAWPRALIFGILLHLEDLWPYPQVSDPGPFGPPCFVKWSSLLPKDAVIGSLCLDHVATWGPGVEYSGCCTPQANDWSVQSTQLVAWAEVLHFVGALLGYFSIVLKPK